MSPLNIIDLLIVLDKTMFAEMQKPLFLFAHNMILSPKLEPETNSRMQV